jgi:2-oxoisovalerate dehydrogenase E1 component
MLDRAMVVDANFIEFVERQKLPPRRTVRYCTKLTLAKKDFLSLFPLQLISRHLDLKARELRQKNLAFYTIGSCVKLKKSWQNATI